MEYNVIIVDDSPSMRKIMLKTIRMSGFPVKNLLEAENGEEALDKCQESWVDIIITDINMPVMDGLQFIEHLQRDEVLHSVPVVVVSSDGREPVIEKAKTLGVVQYLKKPFQPETIAEVLKEIMGHENYANEYSNTEDLDF